MGTDSTPLSSSLTKNQTLTSLRAACEHRVQLLISKNDLAQYDLTYEKVVDNLTQILSRNLTSGRVQRVIEQQTPILTPDQTQNRDDSINQRQEILINSYIDQIIPVYLSEHKRIENLAAKDASEWQRLFQQLTHRAYQSLLRLELPTNRAIAEAPDFAQHTCEVIFSHPFPFDVSFNAWATRILQNHILGSRTRSRDLIDREPNIFSLDYAPENEASSDLSLYELLTDDSGMYSPFERLEVREWLLQAIDCLPSRAQQQVIIDSFLYELPDKEIAQRLGKTKNAVYVLRYRALRRLKAILTM